VLEALYLDHNQLSGAIPAELALLPALEFLWLSGNQLPSQEACALCRKPKMPIIHSD
jgi:Leucine-rich repeat (LRR) protein